MTAESRRAIRGSNGYRAVTREIAHSRPVVRLLLYPRSDSNRHWTVFETVASANWATGACNHHDIARRRRCAVPSTMADVSKRSITRKLAKNATRLTSLRSELGTIEEQTRMLGDEAEDMALRAIVAENTGVSRDARRAQEHAEAHRKNRERVVAEIAQLEVQQDELLDRLNAAT